MRQGYKIRSLKLCTFCSDIEVPICTETLYIFHMKYGPWLVHYNIQTFTFTSHNSTRWGCETDPNSMAASESDSSDEWELIHFITIFGGYF